MKLKALLISFTFFYSGILLADEIQQILDANIGERVGTTKNSAENCGVTVECIQGGDYRLTYFPGWDDGSIGQVVYFSDKSKWTAYSDRLEVRLFTGPQGHGIATLKFDEATKKFISGQLDSETDSCLLQ